MSNIDLHIHSNISLDGTHSIDEIIQMAKVNNMKKIAICDHNSTRAVQQAILLGKQNNIEVIPGIEIDCVYEGINLHMCAYYIDYQDPRYTTLEQFYLNDSKTKTWQATYKFLESVNLDIPTSLLESIAIQGVIVPEDLANYLLTSPQYDHLEFLQPYKTGSRSDNPNVNFYWDYFSQGKIGYVKEEKIDVLEIIKLIHDTHGLCIIAHPGNNFKDHDDLFEKLLLQVDGVEVFSSYHNESQINKYLDYALKHHKYITCGSDFHGIHKPSIKIGKIPGNHIEKYINI